FTNGARFIKQNEDGDYVFRESPCPFLMEDNYCSVYVSRPKACREYPHTNQKNIKSILTVCLENTKTCPAVYYIFQEIPKHL
ncbi:MAG: YkgJ family cysteine cluster protein, partial [Bacteroidota bacterium]